MYEETPAIVRQVLTEATDFPAFFDLSDGERLNWMIARAYELGRKERSYGDGEALRKRNLHAAERRDGRRGSGVSRRRP